jgi:hypothetical protein
MSKQAVTAPEQFKNQSLVKMLKARQETVVRISPINQSEFRASDNMQMHVNDQGYVDWSTAYFSYKIKGSNSDAAATTMQFTPNAESIFTRMIVSTQNGQVLEDYDHRDVLHAAMYKNTMGSDAGGSERAVMGNITPDDQNLAQGGYGHVYSGARLSRVAGAEGVLGPFATTSNHLGLFGSRNLWPMKYMGQWLFDCSLSTHNKLVESFVTDDGVSASATEVFTITELELVYTSFSFGDAFDALVQEQINSPDGMNLKYDTFVSHTDILESAGEHTSQLTVKSSSLKGIYTTFRAVDSINWPCPDAANTDTNSLNFGYLGGHCYRFGYGKVTGEKDTYNYVINNRIYPSFSANIESHGYPELLKALSRFGDSSRGSYVSSLLGVDNTSYIGGDVSVAGLVESGAFMLGVNLEQQGEDGLMSGIDTTQNLDVSFKIRRSVEGAAGLKYIQLNHFSHVDRICKILPNYESLVVK